ncbi:hypothetical protein ACIGKQ_16415 [Gordonia sp. NPDC062954]|uniref:hypothetical protein n=1 Tax=Gordonia sp. NPDC062954 TaxID=3364003 RepID=UPI0037C709F7
MSDQNTSPTNWRAYAAQLTARQRRMCERSEAESSSAEAAEMARDFATGNDFQHQCEAERASLDVPPVGGIHHAGEWFTPDDDHPMTWRELFAHRQAFGDVSVELCITETLDAQVVSSVILIDMLGSRDYGELDATQARALSTHLDHLAALLERGTR